MSDRVAVGQIWIRNDGDTGWQDYERRVEKVNESFAYLRTVKPESVGGSRFPLTRVRIRNGRLPGHKRKESSDAN